MALLTFFVFFASLSSTFGKTFFDELNYIFRDSPLLHEVQFRQVFDTPEYFLRLKLLKPQRDILYEFKELKILNIPFNKRKQVLKEFVERNFENTSGTEPWTPPDFQKNPKLLKKIQDKRLRQRLQQFNLAWLEYGRKLTKDVFANPKSYSFIPVPKPFFVSSHKEHEMGYWESFWIFQGLLACDMLGSARDLMENIFAIVDKMGYCPPYNRVYFIGRTAPPTLPLMMSAYLDRTNDTDFLAEHLLHMDSDLTTWIQQRLTILESPFHAFLIVVEDWWPQIRAEQYREDVLSVIGYKEQVTHGFRQMLWEADQTVLSTSVLLTALTEASARVLAAWLREYGHKAKARILIRICQEMNYTLHNLLMIGDCWADLHLDRGYSHEVKSSLSPMWLGVADSACISAKNLPISTGPEAVICSGSQAHRWMSDICKVNVDSLVDMAAAFQIASTTADLALEHPPLVDLARVKPLSPVLLVAVIVLFRCWLALWCK